MEPLWSPVVATGGNRWQIGSPQERRKQAKTVAIGCDQLPEAFHGKQGVCDGLPPVAGGPLPAKEGVDLQALRRCLRQPLARHVHCCTIMQDLIIARAPNRLDARKKTAGRQYDAPLNARPRCGPRRAPTAPISSPRRSLRRLRAEGVVEERNQALLVFARSDVDAAGV